jgi:16S rRNA processing protein RimM
LIIKFKEFSNRNQSEEVEGALFLIPEEALVSQKGETIYLREVLGFEVYLQDQVVGRVKDFSSNGPQDLLVIENEKHQFEVPFVAAFIVKIEFEAQKLIMDFPEDLMNLHKID